MERKLVNASTLLTVAVLLLGMIAVIPTNAEYPGPRIYIAETPIDGGTIGYGQRFNVSIWIENVTLADPGLDGWQVELHYDDSIINVTQDSFGVRAWPDQFRGANKYNTSYVFYTATSVTSSITSPSYTHIGAHEGSLLIADAIIAGTAWKGTKGLLCIIEFEITATPETGKLNCTLDITNPYTWIKPDELQNKATFEDGWYEWEWAKPGPAHMGVQPTYTKYGPYPPSAVGEAFDIEVYIEDLDIMWELQNATFDLVYNATVIDVIGGEENITIAPLWGTNIITIEGVNPAVIKGADRLLALQSDTDYGWDWIVTGLTEHSTDPSGTNLYGVTALGLLDAYERTGDTRYFNACKAVADWIAWGNASEGDMYNGHDGFHFGYPEDYIFLVRFAEVSGNTTYRDYAIAGWEWTKENRGEYYGDGNQTNLYDYNLAHYGTHGGAIWNTADFALAALACGDYEWAKNMTDVIAANIPNIDETDDYRFIGWGKSLMAFQAVDPTAYAGVISDIVASLTASQQPDGSFEGWVQDEAYAIMGLVAVGETEAAEKAAAWLVRNQGYDTIVGGWELPDGNEYSEVTSEAIQALVAVPASEILNTIHIYVGDPSTTPGGSPPADELVCTIKFTVMMQSEVPTVPAGYVDSSPLNFQDEVLMDHYGCVDTAAPSNGVVDIYALIGLPMALFKVEPSYIELGPEPSIGKEFDVNVAIGGPTAEGLHFAWYLIGVQFRLYYDPTMLEVVNIEEGPFLKDGPWNLHGTFFIASVESDGLGPHVMIGDMLLPNSQGVYDMTSWPNGTGTIVTIRFRVADQPICPCDYTGSYWESELGLGPLFSGEWAIDREGNWIPIDEASNVNGTYRIYESPSYSGRFIDLYGGAYNAGHGLYPFPAPYGGQGLNNPMDLVIPQSEVKLFARVEYNCWPVQQKIVNFEIEGPFEKDDQGGLVEKPSYQIWAKLTAITDEDGIATLVFRMPWPCEDPYNITGIWKITATVNLYDEIVTDTMIFYYEDLVQITKVTTDHYYYYHDEYVEVTVEYCSHAMQEYDALFAITLTDEVGVPIAMVLKEKTVGGAEEFCTCKEGSFTEELYIPKWAAAGLAYVHVNAFDKDPTEGGFAWCPEYPPVEIYILPLEPPTVYIEPSSATMNKTAGETATFKAIVSGGLSPYTYAWYGDGYLLQEGPSDTLTIYSWSPGIHTIKVVITDFYGRTAEAEATLEVIE